MEKYVVKSVGTLIFFYKRSICFTNVFLSGFLAHFHVEYLTNSSIKHLEQILREVRTFTGGTYFLP